MMRPIRAGLLLPLVATCCVSLPIHSSAAEQPTSGTRAEWAIAPEPKSVPKRGLMVRERTVLQREVTLPGGTVLPAGTILPAGTLLPAGTALPGTAYTQGAPVDEPLREPAPRMRKEAPALTGSAAPDFDNPESSGNAPYISGGIGYSERADMDRVKSKYNLRMLFAEKGSGSYLSDVKVQVTDSAGAAVLSAVADGPWFFTQLAPGTYNVTVDSAGEAQTRPVKVPDTGAVQADFYWAR